ncbi:MAG: Glycosyl transferase [Parcubacteria group bacterium Gr01-1014_17]|nr:MAG: Glycosyl transferase [Parcubacteria group bacterium Gr01-1014_17]
MYEKSEANKRNSVVVIMPAYNAARTLEKTYRAIPYGAVDEIILVDDASRDDTLAVAHTLPIRVFKHKRNYGYGANQKTCYTEALKTDNDIIVMLHPDYQYDPSLLPTLIAPIAEGRSDIVLGSRLMGKSPVAQGMPWWKYLGNRLLTRLENIVFGLHLSEYHTGYRAYARRVLEEVHYEMNSDKFVFDQEFIAQAVCNKYRIVEVPVPTKYFPEASSASFRASVVYGFSILFLLARYLLHRNGWVCSMQFESLPRRYKTAVR